MSSHTLLLFDIDGTLLTSGGAGEFSLRAGFLNAFGREEDLHGVQIAGRTDSGIARQVLQKHALPATPENLERFYSGYLRELERQLPLRQGRVLEGILPLLEALRRREEVVLGLLTGNLERGAHIKLRHYALDGVFSFGAFADDHHDRNQLGPVAIQRARSLYGLEFSPERIFVLGDTEHDIACARACGARAVAVATGNSPVEALAPHGPDHLFSTFADWNAVLRALGLG